MKKHFSLALVAAALFFASTARAQELRVRADIPFDFVVGTTVYSAGTYTIGPIMHASNALVLDGGDARTIVIPNACSTLNPPKSTKLVFDRMGGTYFLHQIWVEGRTSGAEFPKGKTEIQMASNGTKNESVTIVAQLIR